MFSRINKIYVYKTHTRFDSHILHSTFRWVGARIAYTARAYTVRNASGKASRGHTGDRTRFASHEFSKSSLTLPYGDDRREPTNQPTKKKQKQKRAHSHWLLAHSMKIRKISYCCEFDRLSHICTVLAQHSARHTQKTTLGVHRVFFFEIGIEEESIGIGLGNAARTPDPPDPPDQTHSRVDSLLDNFGVFWAPHIACDTRTGTDGGAPPKGQFLGGKKKQIKRIAERCLLGGIIDFYTLFGRWWA